MGIIVVQVVVVQTNLFLLQLDLEVLGLVVKGIVVEIVGVVEEVKLLAVVVVAQHLRGQMQRQELVGGRKIDLTRQVTEETGLGITFQET